MSDLAALERRAVALEAKAAAESRHYDRTTWIRFTAVFFPVPLIVVILRLRVDAWTYYVFGALIVLSAAVMFWLDSVARARRDAAIGVAGSAREALEDARSSQKPGPA